MVNYIELSSLLDQVVEKAQLAKSECSKEHPDKVEICNYAIEDLGGLLDQIEACVFSR